MNKFVENLETHLEGLRKNIARLAAPIERVDLFLTLECRTLEMGDKLAEFIKVIQALGRLVQIVFLLIVRLGYFTDK